MNPAVAQLTERVAAIVRERKFNRELAEAIARQKVQIARDLAATQEQKLLANPNAARSVYESVHVFPNGRY